MPQIKRIGTAEKDSQQKSVEKSQSIGVYDGVAPSGNILCQRRVLPISSVPCIELTSSLWIKLGSLSSKRGTLKF